MTADLVLDEKAVHSLERPHPRSSLSLSMRLSVPHGAQIADLGSARSATAEGYHFVEQQAPDQVRTLTLLLPLNLASTLPMPLVQTPTPTN